VRDKVLKLVTLGTRPKATEYRFIAAD
jgi:hypothetical protein